jgi:transcriptional regulator with XRE-family HTH domain
MTPSLGSTIATARKARGWTQAQLAYGAAISRHYVDTIEHDHHIPSWQVAQCLERALEMPAGTLTAMLPPVKRKAVPVTPDDATVARLAREYIRLNRRALANYNLETQRERNVALRALDAVC